jgi:hypothetical protein
MSDDFLSPEIIVRDESRTRSSCMSDVLRLEKALFRLREILFNLQRENLAVLITLREEARYLQQLHPSLRPGALLQFRKELLLPTSSRSELGKFLRKDSSSGIYAWEAMRILLLDHITADISGADKLIKLCRDPDEVRAVYSTLMTRLSVIQSSEKIRGIISSHLFGSILLETLYECPSFILANEVILSECGSAVQFSANPVYSRTLVARIDRHVKDASRFAFIFPVCKDLDQRKVLVFVLLLLSTSAPVIYLHYAFSVTYDEGSINASFEKAFHKLSTLTIPMS